MLFKSTDLDLNLFLKDTIPLKYHFYFWILYFVFNVIRWGSFNEDYWYSLKANLVEFPIHIIVVYITLYYLIPKYILQKKFWIFVLSIFIILVFVYFVRTGLNYWLVSEDIWPEARTPTKFLELNHIIEVTVGELYVIAFITAIKLMADWIIERTRTEQLQEIQLRTELKFLRTQLQPHFFFNTLNNLYALTLKKSDDASRVVPKLSDMMQYVLYEVKSSKADLFQEIMHINNYVDIERLRFKNRIHFELDITGDIEDIKVPPLLFLSYLENCFKHGLRDNERVAINMSFNVLSKEYLEFRLANNFNPTIIQGDKHGIGISNSKRRLNLLFLNNYKLHTFIKGDIYNLYLKIPVG